MSPLAAEMKAHALEAQKFSRKHLVLELDFSPHSLHELDPQLDALEYALRGGKSPENISMLTRIWGAYLGETIRHRLGGEWSPDSDSQPTIVLSGETLRPHEQVRLRIVEGAKHNVEAWFLDLQARHSDPKN
jgi:hypothetical protein